MSKFEYINLDSSAWTWSFLTTAGTIPAADGGTTCIAVPYKANVLNPSKVSGFTIGKSVPADAVFTDTKNTAGSTDTSSKIFLIGATTQAANSQTYSHDTAYVGTDGKLYSGGSVVLTSHQTIKQDGITGATITRFGTCGVGAGTAAKTVSVTAGTFALAAGSRITVKFTYANTANSPTLNVNSTGAKNIFHQGVQITSGENKSLLAGVVDFVYDGTQWHLIGNYLNTADGATNVVISTTQPTNQKVGDLWFVLSENGYPTSAESETF